MAVDKLGLYNLALGHLAERRIAGLSEAREPRRVLDDFYPRVVGYCLERKYWNFSYRTVMLDPESSIAPAFGFQYAYRIPDDWVRTKLVSAVETLNPPLLQMREEGGYWFTNVAPIYVQYNSNDPACGMDMSLWPETFVDYVALRLASQTCKRITGSDKMLVGPQGLQAQEKRAYTIAAANCAMNDPVGFQPMSSWVRARRGLVSAGGDDPTGGSLIP